MASSSAIPAAFIGNEMRTEGNGKHRMRQVLLDLASRRWDLPRAGVGSRSTPLLDNEGSVH
jgi:hypothetical protein